jgi:hypothetical protein
LQIGRIMTDEKLENALLVSLPRSSEPDAHGQAALLLAESILHALVEVKTLSVDEALSVIETTCEVKVEVAERSGESHGRMEESLGLLRAISASFAADGS